MIKTPKITERGKGLTEVAQVIGYFGSLKFDFIFSLILGVLINCGSLLGIGLHANVT